jgi:PEP-CTERM motif
MKRLAAIVGMVLGLVSTSAMAGVVQVNLNQLLPNSFSSRVSIDGDATADIGLAASANNANYTFLSGRGLPASWSYSWLSQGQVVDSSLTWTAEDIGVTTTAAPVTPGLNYLAVRNTSIGNYYGYITLDFQEPYYQTNAGGYTQTLVSYTYDNTGGAITVGAVPVPATLALLGLGFVGMGVSRRKQA